jgi:hypothetical protein
MDPDTEAVVEEVAELPVLPPGFMVAEKPFVQVGLRGEEGKENLDSRFMDHCMPEGVPLGPCPWLHPRRPEVFREKMISLPDRA